MINPATDPSAIAPVLALAAAAAMADPLLEVEFAIEEAAVEGKKSVATFGFESKKPGVRSAFWQPLSHGFDLQQPINGRLDEVHVY